MQLAEQHVDFFKLSDFTDAGFDANVNSASAVIGPEGGMVSVTDPASSLYGTSLRVPSGALETPVNIIIREGNHSCDFGLGPSLKLLPSGLHFKRAATLTVYLTDLRVEADDLEETVPSFYHYDEFSDQWTRNSAARLKRLGNAVLCELDQL